MKQRLIQILKITIPLTIGFGLIGWIYKDMQWGEIRQIFRSDVSYGWFLPVIGFSVLGHLFRALRWQMLLNTIKPGIPFLKIINAVFINYGVNLLLPRVGEVSRCATMSKTEAMPFTTLFGTLIGERFIDVITVFLLTIAAMVIQFDYFSNNLHNFSEQVDRWIEILFSFKTALCLIVFVAIAIIAFKHLRHSRIGTKTASILTNFWQGILSLTRIKNLPLFMLYTVCLWGSYLMQLYLFFFAFDFTSNLTFASSIVMFAMGSLAYGLPVQGGIGPWHFAIIMTMMFYGIGKEPAGAFALFAHAVPNIVIIVGAIYASCWFAYSKKARIVTQKQ